MICRLDLVSWLGAKRWKRKIWIYVGLCLDFVDVSIVNVNQKDFQQKLYVIQVISMSQLAVCLSIVYASLCLSVVLVRFYSFVFRHYGYRCSWIKSICILCDSHHYHHWKIPFHIIYTVHLTSINIVGYHIITSAVHMINLCYFSCIWNFSLCSTIEDYRKCCGILFITIDRIPTDMYKNGEKKNKFHLFT